MTACKVQPTENPCVPGSIPTRKRASVGYHYSSGVASKAGTDSIKGKSVVLDKKSGQPTIVV